MPKAKPTAPEIVEAAPLEETPVVESPIVEAEPEVSPETEPEVAAEPEAEAEPEVEAEAPAELEELDPELEDVVLNPAPVYTDITLTFTDEQTLEVATEPSVLDRVRKLALEINPSYGGVVPETGGRNLHVLHIDARGRQALTDLLALLG